MCVIIYIQYHLYVSTICMLVYAAVHQFPDFELEDEALFGSLDVTVHKIYGLKAPTGKIYYFKIIR